MILEIMILGQAVLGSDIPNCDYDKLECKQRWEQFFKSGTVDAMPTTTTIGPAFKCRNGYNLIYDLNLKVKCAKYIEDIVEPEK